MLVPDGSIVVNVSVGNDGNGERRHEVWSWQDVNHCRAEAHQRLHARDVNGRSVTCVVVGASVIVDGDVDEGVVKRSPDVFSGQEIVGVDDGVVVVATGDFEEARQWGI